jgi:hypothetical protein
MPLNNQIIVPKYVTGSSQYQETVLTPQEISAVGTTGDQTISGAKTFDIRPSVNGSGVLLSGDLPSLNGLVYTTGDQTISGVKTFVSRPTVNGTGVLLSGEAASLPTTIVYTTGNQTISGVKTFTNNIYFIGVANTGYTNYIFSQTLPSNSWGFNSTPTPYSYNYTGWTDTNTYIELVTGSQIMVKISGGGGGYFAKWYSSADLVSWNAFNLYSGSTLTGEFYIGGSTRIATGYLPSTSKYLAFTAGSANGGGSIYLTVSGYRASGFLINPKFGFGTATPDETVHIVGNTKISGNLTVSGVSVLLNGAKWSSLIYDNQFGGSSDGFATRTSNGQLVLAATGQSTAVPSFYGWDGFSNTSFTASTARTSLGLGTAATSASTDFYSSNNPSGFITGVDTSSLYPRSNPSGFVTGVTNHAASHAAAGSDPFLPTAIYDAIDNSVVLEYDSTLGWKGMSSPASFRDQLQLGTAATSASTDFYSSNNPSGFITGVNLSSYITTGELAQTSGNLQSQIYISSVNSIAYAIALG